MKLSLVGVFLLFLLAGCQSTDTKEEATWGSPKEIKGLWMKTKVEFSKKGTTKIDSAILLAREVEFDSITRDSLFNFNYPVDTTCYYLNKIPFSYSGGRYFSGTESGLVSAKGDSLKIRWVPELSLDPDVIITYIKFTKALPRPFCPSFK